MSVNYIGKNSLARFLEKLYETFSKKGHAHSKADILDFPKIDTTLTTTGAIADARAVGEALSDKIDKSFINDIEAIAHNAVYGIVDGSMESIRNDKAPCVRDYSFYQHPFLITAEFAIATNIGNYSFYKCPSLVSIDVPSATSVGVFAFKGCSALTSINYPLVITVGQGAFDECVSLSSVNLPLLESVEPLTFRKCEALTTVNLPIVANIGTQAFYSSGITSLTLCSSTVITLENEDAFYFTPIEEGTGYIYVPSNLLNDYKSADGWSAYANQIRAIE